MIYLALQQYNAEYAEWPKGDTLQILTTLRGNNPKKFEFLTLIPRNVNEKGEFLDPWDTPYLITRSLKSGFVIRSAGPNKRFDDTPSSDDLQYPELR